MRTHRPSFQSIRRAIVFTLVLAKGAMAQEAPAPVKDQSGLFPEPAVMSTAVEFVARFIGESSGEGNPGFYPAFEGIAPGSGWVTAGAGYRERVFGRRAIADGSFAVSWRGYQSAQARLEFTELLGGRLAAGGKSLWQNLRQLQYFGIGNASPDANRSDYELQTLDAVGYARYRPLRWFSVEGRSGVLLSPQIGPSTGAFDRSYPDAETTFADEPTFSIDRQPRFLHTEFAVTSDTRDYPGYPTRGGLYRAAWADYSDRTVGAFSFQRYELEGAQFLPITPEHWTLALHGRASIATSAADQSVPAYLMPSLGGSNSIRSFDEYRFHDRNLLVATAEVRVALLRHLDAAVFVDAGSVAARAGDLGLSQRAYGVGLRVHTYKSTIERVEVAKGPEGWRLLFKMNDPLQLHRLTRRRTDAPSVP